MHVLAGISPRGWSADAVEHFAPSIIRPGIDRLRTELAAGRHGGRKHGEILRTRDADFPSVESDLESDHAYGPLSRWSWGRSMVAVGCTPRRVCVGIVGRVFMP